MCGGFLRLVTICLCSDITVRGLLFPASCSVLPLLPHPEALHLFVEMGLRKCCLDFGSREARSNRLRWVGQLEDQLGSHLLMRGDQCASRQTTIANTNRGCFDRLKHLLSICHRLPRSQRFRSATQDLIHARLPAGTSRLIRVQHIGIDADGYRFLGRRFLRPALSAFALRRVFRHVREYLPQRSHVRQFFIGQWWRVHFIPIFLCDVARLLTRSHGRCSLLSSVGLPKTDHPHLRTAFCEYQHVQSSFDVARRDVPDFVVTLTRVKGY